MFNSAAQPVAWVTYGHRLAGWLEGGLDYIIKGINVNLNSKGANNGFECIEMVPFSV